MMKTKVNKSEQDNMEIVVKTMLTAIIIVAGVAVIFRLGRVMISDLRGMGL